MGHIAMVKETPTGGFIAWCRCGWTAPATWSARDRQQAENDAHHHAAREYWLERAQSAAPCEAFPGVVSGSQARLGSRVAPDGAQTGAA